MNGCNGNVRALERRDLLMKWGRRVGFLALFSAIAFGGFRGYGAWRKQHLARQTDQFAARGDFPSAVLVARRLLQLDENNLSACRAMAEMAEKSGSADALTWRKKIAQLEPELPANQMSLAKSALRFGQNDLAHRVLNSLPASARNSVEYHEVVAAEALAQKDPAAAETHFAAALELSPNDTHLALNLAIMRLASPDARVLARARETLARLATEPLVRAESLRALTADALARKDRANALRFATRLTAEPNTTFSDALVYFEAAEGTEFAAGALERLRAKAAASPGTAAEFITWLNRHGLAQVAAHWASLLPKEIATQQPIPLAIAESYSFLEDWRGLQALVRGKNWGDVEALRLAVESHALHRLSRDEESAMQTQTAWRAALKTAQSKPEQLLAIAQLAQGWGYAAEAEEAWWTMANSNENATAALSILQRHYKTTQDTRGLLRVAKRAYELNPSDLVAANNRASLGLLIAGDNTAQRLAFKLHHEHPANRAFAATYAYALHTEGKTDEGLKLLESLKEEELRNPAIAAYYVVMLVENGNLEQARSYLADAKRAALLPEEEQLLTAAARKLSS